MSTLPFIGFRCVGGVIDNKNSLRGEGGLTTSFVCKSSKGVSKFVIFDDGSEDDPWSVLEKYVALGIVEYHNLTGHPEAGSFEFQIRNVNGCFKDLRARSQEEGLRWLLFPDVDEFVMSQTPKETLSQALNARYDGAPCLEVARTYYGSSFIHKRPQKGLIIENYLLSSPDGADGFPKMIANINPTNAKRNATALYSIHNIVDQVSTVRRMNVGVGSGAFYLMSTYMHFCLLLLPSITGGFTLPMEGRNRRRHSYQSLCQKLRRL